MQILIIDSNTELQARYAVRIQKFPVSELETMDLGMVLASEKDFRDHLKNVDVVVLGAGLKERSFPLAKEISKNMPELKIILFVFDTYYSQRTIRNAHYCGVRKVLSDSVSDLDFLQELVAIDAEFRRDGKAPLGRIISFIGAKGGVGVTSLVAAIAETANENLQKSLMLDLDTDTHDLSRGLAIFSPKGAYFSDWLQGNSELNRKSFSESLIPVSRHVNMLLSPDDYTLTPELICTENGTALLERIVDLARYSHKYVFIDTAGNKGYAIDNLLQISDDIILVVSDCLLDASGLEIYLHNLQKSIGSLDKVKIVCNGTTPEFMLALRDSINIELSKDAWIFAELPKDFKAAQWPSSGSSLYGCASKPLKSAINNMASYFEILPKVQVSSSKAAAPSWFKVLSGGGKKALELLTAETDNNTAAMKESDKQSNVVALPLLESKVVH